MGSNCSPKSDTALTSSQAPPKCLSNSLGDAQRRETLTVGFQSKKAPGRLRRAALAILSTERLRKASRASVKVADEINSDFHRRSFAVSKTMNDLKAQCDKINAELAQLPLVPSQRTG